MRLILNPFNLLEQCIEAFKRKIYPRLLQKRRLLRLAQFNISDRSLLPTAQIDARLTSDCDRSNPWTLCVRASSTYRHFYKQCSHSQDDEEWPTGESVTLMAIHLRKYTDYSEYIRSIRKHSFFDRKAKKAVKAGFYFAPFQYQNYLPDIDAIRQSQKWRAWGLPADPYVLTPEALNTKPSQFIAIQEPKCMLHWEKWFGIFQAKPDYEQGQIKTHQQLIAYARIRRIGNTAKYAELIGNYKYLNSGIMALLHLEIMKYFLDPPYEKTDLGLEFITYNNVERGADGLFFWKRKALFNPYAIEFLQNPLPSDFDPHEYLLLNPDIAHTDTDPGTHYRNFGHLEQRQYKTAGPK